MTHPTREDWMSYLYDETDAATRRAFQDHLNQCEPCRDQVTAWQETRRHLDTWKTSRPRPRLQIQNVWMRWAATAAAAFLVVAAGFAMGRSMDPSRAEVKALRDEVAGLQSSFDERVVAASQAETKRQLQAFAESINTRLEELQAQHVTDYATLRQELETVAVLTEAGFRQTQDRMLRLASYEPADNSTQTPN